ncbi:MAG: hypothetical protein Q4E12_04715, partial [Coriobacteriia bacterium]|nr:hypothetical protein [Coriobacteriia bacterium]
MRKSNWIIYAVALLISAFLLWLWYHLNFNAIDSPLDLVLSIIWWCLVLVACLAIRNREKVRREKVNTCFLAPMKLYNSEAGLMELTPGASAVESIQQVLEGLKYNFHMETYPGEKDDEGNETDKVNFVYVVRTTKFKPADKQEDKQAEAQADAAAQV